MEEEEEIEEEEGGGGDERASFSEVKLGSFAKI